MNLTNLQHMIKTLNANKLNEIYQAFKVIGKTDINQDDANFFTLQSLFTQTDYNYYAHQIFSKANYQISELVNYVDLYNLDDYDPNNPVNIVMLNVNEVFYKYANQMFKQDYKDLASVEKWGIKAIQELKEMQQVIQDNPDNIIQEFPELYKEIQVILDNSCLDI